jgi:hypothetical protein
VIFSHDACGGSRRYLDLAFAARMEFNGMRKLLGWSFVLIIALGALASAHR